MEVSRTWLQYFFENELPTAKELVDLFNTHAFEIEGLNEKSNDAIIDVDVLPNRSSDCLSHRGIAKEVSTLLGQKLKEDPLRTPLPKWETPKKLEVTVDNPALAPRYMAAILHGVKVGPSPKWLVEALSSIGQKSVNNVVDATNFVMFNLGQPVHAFDLNKLSADENGRYHIRVRLAKEKEEITTLTGDEYVLKETHQLIVDGNDDTPLALAGIKGGKHAEVDEGTKDIVVEVANFDPVIVRKASTELKLHTDASLRFQNTVVPHLCAFAMRDVIALIEEIASGKQAGVCDVYDGYKENEPIQVPIDDITTQLGVTLTEKDIEEILIRLEWEFSRDKDHFTVTGPWERTDVSIKEDVIEEIGRIYGYKNITSVLPEVPNIQDVTINKAYYYTELLQEFCVGLGYSEVLTYTIVDRGEVELANPFASDKSFMRANLKDGIRKALESNLQQAPLLGLDVVQIFEIGTVFTKKGERLHIALGAQSNSRKQSKVDAQLKSDVECILKELGAQSDIKIENGVCEIDMDALLPLLPTPKRYKNTLQWNTEARYTPWSAFPYVLRDIAVWVPQGTDPDEVFEVIRTYAGDLLVRNDLFDTFEKDERVSFAWHLVFQSFDRTLTDEEINTIMEQVTEKIHEKGDWKVR